MITIYEIAKACRGELIRPTDIKIEKLLTDSRKLFVAENTLFVALRGLRHDATRYIDDLYSRGIRAFVCPKDFDTTLYLDATFVLVDDTLKALQDIAHAKRKQSKCRVVAIVGSNGKTIVKEWLNTLIGDDMKTVRSPRSYNSQVGVALSLWNIEEETELSIIEAGISERGEMCRLEEIIEPDDVIVTNIGEAHQENFDSIDEKLCEKLRICRNAKRVFYCKHHALVDKTLHKLYPDKELMAWEYPEEVCLSDIIKAENTMHALSYARTLGINEDKLKQRQTELRNIGMRMEQKEGHNNCTIIDDAYSADLTSLEIALDTLHTLGNRQGLSRTLILSDLQQTGLDTPTLYKRVEQLLEEKQVTRLIGIGDNISEALSKKTQRTFFATTDDFLNSMSTADFCNEAILLKGSRNFGFERIAEMLEQKRHRTVMEINLGALAHNIGYFRSHLQPETKLLAMVKAYSYGTGSFEIAKLMQAQGVDYLGVAFADEGYDLRAAGITLPIAVMNPEEHAYDLMLNYDMEPEIYTFESVKKYSQAATKLGIDNAGIHIKINTGMTRSGFEPHEAIQIAQKVKECRNLRVISVFSHLVGSDEACHDDFTNEQIALFDKAAEELQKELGYKVTRHILNSAGIERFTQHQYEMVRLGIGLYGISAIDNSKLKNVATLKSYISQIREVPTGTTVGYSRRTQVNRPSRIAVVPIGYADGLDRRLSNGVGTVIVNGKTAPIAGNVCMDICMIDVTDIDNVHEGDTVVIFGDNNPVWELSNKIGTIPYEVLTGIGRRVKRIYYTEES